jgi:tetratricopeptide (TPR) repeat protein
MTSFFLPRLALLASLVLPAAAAAADDETAPRQGGTRVERAAAAVTRGDRLKEQRKYAEALRAYAEAVENNPELVAPHVARAWIFNELGKSKDAEAAATEAVRLTSEDAGAYRERGYARLQLKEFPRAVSDLNKSIKLEKDGAEREQRKENAAAYGYRADAYVEMLEYEKALADADRFIVLQPDSASGYNRRGRIYLETKAFDEAIQDFSTAVGKNAGYAAAYANRGTAHLKKRPKNVQQALRDLNRAIELDPNVAAFYEGRAQIYVALGNEDAATADEAKARRLQGVAAKK